MSRIRVAIDGTPLQDSVAKGVGRYVRALIEGVENDVDLSVVVDDRRPLPEINARTVSLRGPRGAPRLVWLELATSNWLRTFDGLFHGTFNSVPLHRRPTGGAVVTIHDLAPQRFSVDFGRSPKRTAWRISMRQSVRASRTIIVPSTFTRDEAVAEWNIDPDRIFVIPNGVSEVFSPARRADTDRVTDQLGVSGPYVVAVGGARRRNVTAAVAAWRLVRRRVDGLSLVVLGEGSLPPEPGLLQPPRLGDDGLAALLAGAKALLYPTRYEGFGLPALEAAACGTPTVCAPLASLPEILGDAAAWAESTEPEPMADALARLIEDERARATLGEAALRRAQQAPTWEDNARATVDVYSTAAAESPAIVARPGTRSPDQRPSVSAVIVNWNAGASLLECLESLRAHAPSCAWDAVVIDNASTDGSAELVRERAPWAQLIVNRENRGLAPANNQGIASTSGEYVLISNPDVVFRPNAVDALIDLLERRPRAAFAVSRLIHADGTPHPAAGDLPTLADAFIGRQLGRGGTDSGYWWRQWAHDEERKIGHGGEACYLVRRAAIESIGLQDEHFPLDWEGIEWSRRAAAHGWEIWFCHTAEVVHTGGVSVRQAMARWIVLSHRGMYRYFRTEVPAAARPALWLGISARAVAKLGLLRLQGRRLYDASNLRVPSDPS